MQTCTRYILTTVVINFPTKKQPHRDGCFPLISLPLHLQMVRSIGSLVQACQYLMPFVHY